MSTLYGLWLSELLLPLASYTFIARHSHMLHEMMLMHGYDNIYNVCCRLEASRYSNNKKIFSFIQNTFRH
jgi:hypothetical protein